MVKSKKVKKDVKNMHTGRIGLLKLSTISFILFLITVWPALHNLVMKVHWGWYLAATIIFGALICSKHRCYCK